MEFFLRGGMRWDRDGMQNRRGSFRVLCEFGILMDLCMKGKREKSSQCYVRVD